MMVVAVNWCASSSNHFPLTLAAIASFVMTTCFCCSPIYLRLAAAHFKLRIAVDDQLKGVAMGDGARTAFIVVFIGILVALTTISIAAQLGRILGLI